MSDGTPPGSGWIADADLSGASDIRPSVRTRQPVAGHQITTEKTTLSIDFFDALCRRNPDSISINEYIIIAVYTITHSVNSRTNSNQGRKAPN
jgi:hypothetical protein